MKEAPDIKDINPAAKCEQLCIPVDDTEDQDLLTWFQQAIDFIRKAQSCGGSVLVHCVQGVSRSPTAGSSFPTIALLLH